MKIFTAERCFALFAVTLLVIGTVRIAPPDLAFYYSYAHSLLYDLDLVFANQYGAFEYGYHELYITPHGYPANDWPPGAGLLWLPFLFLSRIALSAASLFHDGIDTGGFGWFSKWVVTLGATLVYSYGAIWLSYRWCRHEGIEKNAALWASALIGLGSSFTYHLFINSADSHAPSAFFTILLLYYWSRHRNDISLQNAVVLGVLTGFAALIRPHNVLFALIPALELCSQKPPITRCLRFFAVMGFTAFLTFLPQMVVWNQLYGSWFSVPRTQDVIWSEPHIHEMLLSDYHGMIAWSPVFLFSLIGLCASRKHWAYIIPVALQIYVYSCHLAWWAGGSFGNRRMLGCVPLFIFGLANLFMIVQKPWLKAVSILCAFWTLALLFAEVAGTVQLDHYQPWIEIIPAVQNGVLPGITALFAKPQWGEHAAARIAGFIMVFATLFLGYRLFLKFRQPLAQKKLAVALCLVIAINLLFFTAAMRSPKALQTADVSEYLPYDRFNWVVYYEESFYPMRHQKGEEAFGLFLAAAAIEPRHPQPFMYCAYILDLSGSNLLSFHFARQAIMTGLRRDDFIQYFEHLLTAEIAKNRLPKHVLYNERGIIRAIQQNFSGAERDFNLALETLPGYSYAQNNLNLLQEWKTGNQVPLEWE